MTTSPLLERGLVGVGEVQELCVERIVELTFEVVDGDYRALTRIVEAGGGSVEDNGERGLIVRCGHGMTIGFGPGFDPLTVFAQVAFTLAGPWWMHMGLFAQAEHAMNAEWARRSRRQATAVPA